MSSFRSSAVSTFDVPGLCSLTWWDDTLVDWLGGCVVTLGGEVQRFGVGATYRFDAALGCRDLGIIFESLGTKGRVVRWNGELPTPGFTPVGLDEIREINRSYYHAEAYLYPLCAFTVPDGREIIAHCPQSYDRIDLELVDGELLTPRDCKHDDCFHSRLEASPDGRWLLCNGWIWHPANVAHVFDVARALAEPAYLSSTGISLGERDRYDDEEDEDGIVAATFSGERVVGAHGHHLMVSALPSGETIHLHRLAEPAGTQLMAWGSDHVVAFDGHPRVIELATGKIVHIWDELDGGRGITQPSLTMKPPEPPWIARDPTRQRFALGWPDRIVVVTG